MPSEFDVIAQLRACAFGVCSFPVTKVSLSLEHDLAQHKPWGVDGAEIENTGRAPLAIECEIPFINSIAPGKGEKWSPSVLYPDGFRAFVAIFERGSTEVYVHPEFGPIRVKPHKLTAPHDAGKRGGVVVQASFLATNDTEDQPDPIASDSPVSAVEVALDLDTLAADADAIKELVPELPEFDPDFSEQMRLISAVGDRIASISQQTFGKINRIAASVDHLANSVERARNALAWPVKRAANRMRAATDHLTDQVIAAGGDLVYYTVPAAITVAALGSALGVPAFAILRMNPDLLKKVEIAPLTIVKYPGKKRR